MGNDIDRYVETLDAEWKRSACAQLLADIRGSGRLGEHIKWGHPYFELDGAAVLKWFCAKDWINVYFFRGRELPDPHGLFAPSSNARMLTVKVTPEKLPDRTAFTALVRDAVTLAGGDNV